MRVRARSLILALACVASAACERPQRLDVLLITLDTTRADRLGCYGYADIETPAIDRLAASGVRYERAYTPAPITLPAHTSMLTGTYPIAHGVRANHGFYVPQELRTLAEILRDEGYATAAVVGAFPLDSQTGIDQGFEHYDDDYPSSLESGRHPRLRRFFDERPAAEVSRAALSWLDGLEQSDRRPFFLWTHFFDPHQPQQPPSPFRERYPDSPYDAEIASVDEAIGQILRRLEQMGRLERTLTVLTADHGEGLGDHGELTHALLLYSSTLRVPLVLRDPRQLEAAVVEAPVSTVDIFPTVLERLGLPVPEEAQGLVLPTSDDEADEAIRPRKIYGETLYGRLAYGWSPLQRLTTESRALIRGPGLELYDAAELDEIDELSERQPERLAEMLRLLGRRRQQLSPGGSSFSRGRGTDEARARLVSLGYAASASAAVDSDEIDAERADPRLMMEVFELDMEGGAQLEQGAYELAAPTFERALALDPTNPSLLASLARAYFGLGEAERARRLLERLLTLEPQNVPAHLLLARHLRSAGGLARAFELLERVVAIDPEDLATRMLLAHVAEDLGRLERSQEIYLELLERQGEHAPALNGLGTLLYRLGDVDGARARLEEARAKQPFYAPAWLNLAVVAYDRGDIDEARRLVDRALVLRPSYGQALDLRQMIRASGSPAAYSLDVE